jgi:uncharacterized protein (TIGR00730 family)
VTHHAARVPPRPQPPRQVVVYLGSNDGLLPAHAVAAEALGRELAGAGIGVRYGGGSTGHMGRMARAALAAGGTVVGVIPSFMVEWERALLECTELHVVDSMHERKLAMITDADAVVALPGGVGTLEELLEAITWRQLGLWDGPIVVVDVDGYYTPLFDQLGRAVDAGYAPRTWCHLVPDATSAVELLASGLADGGPG